MNSLTPSFALFYKRKQMLTRPKMNKADR